MKVRKLYWVASFLVISASIHGCGLTTAQRKEIEVFGQAATTLGASSNNTSTGDMTYWLLEKLVYL